MYKDKILGYVLIFFMAMGLCFSFEAKTFAKNPDTVVWGRVAFNGVKYHEGSFIDKALLVDVADIVDNKLKSMQLDGKLPFSITEETDILVSEDMTAEPSVTLIPLVMNDRYYLSKHTVKGDSYYKAVLLTQIDLALCYYPGNGDRLRVIQVVPLVGYSLMGENGEYKNLDALKADLRPEFIACIKELVDSEWKFRKKALKDAELKAVTPDTYQVTKVNILSNAVNGFYEKNGRDINDAKALIGAAYSGAFAFNHPELVVLPCLEGNAWEADAAKSTFSFSLGDTGKYITMEKAANEVVLEVAKVGKFAVPLEKANSYIKVDGYSVTMRNQFDGNSAVEFVKRQKLVNPDEQNKAEYDLEGILSEVFTKTAKSLAGKKE